MKSAVILFLFVATVAGQEQMKIFINKMSPFTTHIYPYFTRMMTKASPGTTTIMLKKCEDGLAEQICYRVRTRLILNVKDVELERTELTLLDADYVGHKFRLTALATRGDNIRVKDGVIDESSIMLNYLVRDAFLAGTQELAGIEIPKTGGCTLDSPTPCFLFNRASTKVLIRVTGLYSWSQYLKISYDDLGQPARLFKIHTEATDLKYVQRVHDTISIPMGFPVDFEPSRMYIIPVPGLTKLFIPSNEQCSSSSIKNCYHTITEITIRCTGSKKDITVTLQGSKDEELLRVLYILSNQTSLNTQS